MSTPTVDVTLTLGVDRPFEIAACRIEEGISRVTTAKLELLSREDLDLESALAGDATLCFRVRGAPARRFSLKLGGAAFVGVRRGMLVYEVDLHAPLWLCSLAKNTRKFRDVSTEEVVSKVLAESRVPFAWRLSAPLPSRSYRVQYRETNLDFVLRLLEFEGVYHTTDDDGVLVLADASPSSPKVEGESSFELIEAAGSLERAALGIHALRRWSRVTSGAATVNDFNWKTPRVPLIRSASSGEDPDLEVYDYPSGFREPGEGDKIAQIRLEALRAGKRTVEGQGNVIAFAPARAFTFGGATRDLFAGEYVITHVEHRFRADQGQSTYENTFRAIPKDVPFRPPIVTPRPVVAGNHTAMVRGPAGSEIHTDRHGRCKVQFHWDREAIGTDADSRWIRVLQESASSMGLARTGWEVSVAYLDGDPDRPIGLARHINGAMIPTYSQPKHKNVMTLNTPSSPATGGYNELKLDDSAGSMGFSLRAEKDYIGVVKNDKAERIGNNESHSVAQSLEHAVNGNQSILIGGNSSTAVAGNRGVAVTGDRSLSVGGAESISVGGGVKLTTKGSERETVGSVRLTIDGSIKPPDAASMAKGLAPSPEGALMGAAASAGKGLMGGGGIAGAASAGGASLKAMIPSPQGVASQMTGGLSDGVSMEKIANLICHGSITRTAQNKLTRTVGGAYIAAGIGDISTSVNDGYAEIVGGAKITVAAKGSISQSVGGPLAVTVGGAVLRSAKGDMAVTAKSSKITVGAVASIGSDEKIEIRGKEISLEAHAKLTLKSGGLELELTPGKFSMKGSARVEAGGKIVVSGNPNNLTKG